MPDDGVFYDERPFLLDHEGQIADLLAEQLPPVPSGPLLDPRNHVDERREGFDSFGRTAGKLPRPNYSPRPKPRPSVLYWPTGAMRWAEGWFLAEPADVAAWTAKVVDGQTGELSPLTFRAECRGKKIETDLYMLAPRPITSVTGKQYFAVPLVDERFFWQSIGLGGDGQQNGFELTRDLPMRTWSDVLDVIESHIGGEIERATIDSAYKVPDLELNRDYENIGQLLDAIAFSVGLRFVRELDGTRRLIDVATSTTRLAANLASYGLIAGDGRTDYPWFKRLTVAFRRYVDGHVDCKEPWHTVTIPEESSGSGPTALTETVYTTFPAYFLGITGEIPDDPDNAGDVDAIAAKIQEDWQAWKEGDQFDYRFGNIHEWNPTGFDDFTLYNLGTESRPVPALNSPIDNDAEPSGISKSKPPAVVERRGWQFSTRVQSMGQDFGMRHQLSTDPDVAIVGEAVFKIIDYTEPTTQDRRRYLKPDDWAFARLQKWDTDTADYVDHDPGLIIRLYDIDRHDANDEYRGNHWLLPLDLDNQSVYSCERQRWEAGTSAELLVAKIPCGGIQSTDFIPKRDGDTPGTKDCEIYRMLKDEGSGDVVLSQVFHENGDPFEAPVYNLAPSRALGGYARIDRTWFGRFAIDHPQDEWIGKVTSQLTYPANTYKVQIGRGEYEQAEGLQDLTFEPDPDCEQQIAHDIWCNWRNYGDIVILKMIGDRLYIIGGAHDIIARAQINQQGGLCGEVGALTVNEAVLLPGCQKITGLDTAYNPQAKRAFDGDEVILYRSLCNDGGSGSGTGTGGGACDQVKWNVLQVPTRVACVVNGFEDRAAENDPVGCGSGTGTGSVAQGGAKVYGELNIGGEYCETDLPNSACILLKYGPCDTTTVSVDTSWTLKKDDCCDKQGSGSGQ